MFTAPDSVHDRSTRRPRCRRLVDACLVRCYYKTDYAEGGHGYVYPCGLSRRKLSKGELPRLTAPEFFEYVRKQYVNNLLRRARAFIFDALSKVIP